MMHNLLMQSASRWGRLDRRVKWLLLLVAIVFVVTHHPVFVINAPSMLWLGADTCRVWRGRHYALYKINEEPWWHKLCFLESEMDNVTYNCKDMRAIGREHKGMCFDDMLFPKNNCVVYSFGIDFKFSFDDEMASLGCTVYSFDPSMNVSEHKHADKVYFKPVGLSNVDDDNFQPYVDGYVKRRPIKWRMRRLASIMKELGHTKLTLLKLDIESYEWDVMKDILSMDGLLDSVPQVIIEWHLFADQPPRSRYDELISVFLRFRDSGFRLFYTQSEGEDHYIGGLRTQRETSWVNVRFLDQQP